MTVDERKLDNGVELSPLGFGCAGLMRVTSTVGRRRLLETALDEGITHFDVARMYGLGQAEAELGKFLRGRREEVTIATKFGIDARGGLGALARFQQPARAMLNRYPAVRRLVKSRSEAFEAPRRYDAAVAARSLDKSLMELGTERIDLLFIHGPNPQDDVAVDELLAFFKTARDQGKIRGWGVSYEHSPQNDVIGRLDDKAVLQVRSDALRPVEWAQPHVTFGILGDASSEIRRTLVSDPTLRKHWNDRLNADILAPDVLPRLLLSDAVTRNKTGTVLYSSSVPSRISEAAEVGRRPTSEGALREFRSMLRAHFGGGAE